MPPSSVHTGQWRLRWSCRLACRNSEGVELQGIEPWSREDERVRSTCLVDFDCREVQGRQQPKPFRSYCCLNSVT